MSNPGVRIPAPMLCLAALLLGWGLTRAGFGLPMVAGEVAEIVIRVLGQVVVGAAMALTGWAMWTFHRGRTAIMPSHAASQLVIAGPYLYTRNPMYLALAVTQPALGLVYNSWWPVLLLPPVLLLFRWYVIAREERYLAKAFGSQYDAYRARVGRWFTLRGKTQVMAAD